MGALVAGEMSVGDIEAEAKAAGLLGPGQPISQCKPIRAARSALGVVIRREGYGPGARFLWRLPSGP
jgi:hypothetical protein